MSFHVGQKVVCIKNHSQGVVNEGEIYTIEGIKKNKCCGFLVLDIGKNSYADITVCGKCGKDNFDNTETHWLGNTLFAPLDDWQESEKLVKELSNGSLIEN